VSIQNELKSRSITDQKINIIAVSKTFSIDSIKPLIDHGHLHYGENKVQEAIEKWSQIKENKKNLILHMIGKLQTNKVKFVVPLFDYIHSLDNIKLAKKISSEQKKINRNLKIFIQVNIGDENQKNGIAKDQIADFYKKCVDEFNLDIIGLMCIPPVDGNMKMYFSEMNTLNKNLGLKQLSMGMSSDYLKAIECGATFVRIGSKIFGNRL
jgi:pyridoxal phosphate enzyme (YggS family)